MNEEKVIKKAECGIISEESLNRELKGISYEMRNSLTEDELEIFDCIADKLLKKQNCFYLKKIQDPKSFIPIEVKIGDEVIEVQKYFNFNIEDYAFDREIKDDAQVKGIIICLTNLEIVKILGVNRPAWQISQKVWRLYEKGYVVLKYRRFEPDGKKFVEWQTPKRFLDITIKKKGVLSHRKNIPKEHTEEIGYYFILTSPASQIFIQNLINSKFTIFPHKFYRLREGSRRLIRYLSTQKGFQFYNIPLLNIKEVRDLLQLKIKNVNRLKGRISEILNRRMKDGFISQWKSYGRGWETNYRIKVHFAKSLFNEKSYVYPLKF